MQENIYIRSVITVLVVCYFLSKTKHKKIEYSIKNFLIFIFLTFVVLFSYSYSSPIIRATLLICVYTAINYFLLKYKLTNSVANALMLISLFLILEIIIATCLVAMNINMVEYMEEQSTVYSVVTNYLILSSLVIMTKFKIIIKGMKKLSDSISKFIVNKTFILLEILAIILVTSLLYETIEIKDNLTYFILFVMVYCMFVFILQLQYLIFNSVKTKKLQLTKLNKKYIYKIEEDQIYRHNINNKLIAIKQVGNSDVKLLIDELIYDKKLEYHNAVHLGKVPEYMLSVFYDKLYNQDSISVNITNTLETNLLKMLGIIKFSKLIECIGISLDNVLESLENTKNPYINIVFKEDTEKIVICICNNFSHNLDIDLLGKKDYSNKRKPSGIGLFSISKFKDINHELSIVNNEFRMKFNVYKKPLS